MEGSVTDKPRPVSKKCEVISGDCTAGISLAYNTIPLYNQYVSPVSSLQRTMYPVAPASGDQPSRTEFWVISATLRIVVDGTGLVPA